MAFDINDPPVHRLAPLIAHTADGPTSARIYRLLLVQFNLAPFQRFDYGPPRRRRNSMYWRGRQFFIFASTKRSSHLHPLTDAQAKSLKRCQHPQGSHMATARLLLLHPLIFLNSGSGPRRRTAKVTVLSTTWFKVWLTELLTNLRRGNQSILVVRHRPVFLLCRSKVDGLAAIHL